MFYTLLAKGISDSIEKLKWDFTIDQIHLFYGKCVREEMDNRKFQAICIAQATSYTAIPPMGADGSYYRNKQRNWEKFINQLDFDKATSKQDIRQIKNILMKADIPIKKAKKGDK